jgi:hypothetical protein
MVWSNIVVVATGHGRAGLGSTAHPPSQAGRQLPPACQQGACCRRQPPPAVRAGTITTTTSAKSAVSGHSRRCAPGSNTRPPIPCRSRRWRHPCMQVHTTGSALGQQEAIRLARHNPASNMIDQQTLAGARLPRGRGVLAPRSSLRGRGVPTTPPQLRGLERQVPQLTTPCAGQGNEAHTGPGPVRLHTERYRHPKVQHTCRVWGDGLWACEAGCGFACSGCRVQNPQAKSSAQRLAGRTAGPARSGQAQVSLGGWQARGPGPRCARKATRKRCSTQETVRHPATVQMCRVCGPASSCDHWHCCLPVPGPRGQWPGLDGPTGQEEAY